MDFSVLIETLKIRLHTQTSSEGNLLNAATELDFPGC